MLPIKQSFALKTENGRYFRDAIKMYVDNNSLIEKVIETTDDILKAKKFSTHEEASEEAMKYDFKIVAISTYAEEM